MSNQHLLFCYTLVRMVTELFGTCHFLDNVSGSSNFFCIKQNWMLNKNFFCLTEFETAERKKESLFIMSYKKN